LGPDQQFRDIPVEGPGSGDWAAQIDRITYVRDSHELDVFMFVTTGDKDTALDAAHSIGLMIRQDPPLSKTSVMYESVIRLAMNWRSKSSAH
jgi:hypothetical protein